LLSILIHLFLLIIVIHQPGPHVDQWSSHTHHTISHIHDQRISIDWRLRSSERRKKANEIYYAMINWYWLTIFLIFFFLFLLLSIKNIKLGIMRVNLHLTHVLAVNYCHTHDQLFFFSLSPLLLLLSNPQSFIIVLVLQLIFDLTLKAHYTFKISLTPSRQNNAISMTFHLQIFYFLHSFVSVMPRIFIIIYR
jgi:hypothetical protein